MKKILERGKKLNIILIFFVLFLIFISFLFSYRFFSEATTKEKNSTSSTISKLNKNENPIQLEEILKQNTLNNVTEEILVEEIDLEYNTEYKNNSSLPKGTMQVVQEGKDGKQKVVAIKKYQEGILISEEIVADNVVKASIDKIVEIGTGNGNGEYEAKVGDTCYVTPTTLSVRLEPNNSSDKVCTLNKNAEVTILQILDNWYYISSKERKGYIEKNCVTSKNPNIVETTNPEEYSKDQLLANLAFDMELNKPSNLSLNQFKKILENDSNDKNQIFTNNAEYFYYAEKQYNINGVFLAAVAIHESGWGTSKISKNKNNLFGYGAVDSNPYGGAYSFSSYNEGIDLLARVFVKYYLNPSGASIYDGNIANGKYYSGNTLQAVNKRYASDKNWANSVFKWMKYLYNKL